MEDDDDIWMPPSADGKADGMQILKGHDIPSQYVGSNKDYLSSRTIQTLVDVGALKDVELSVAMRADGIIANLPANGRIEAAELVRMESNTIFPTLFPEEQAALPHLWPLLQVESGTAQQVPYAAAADLTITPMLEEPGGLTVPTSIQISSLPTPWQTVSRRVELVFNHDNDGDTIQIADIQQVLADPQAFTPAEVDQLKAIVVEFNRRATSTEHAIAKAPKPGMTTKHTALGGNSLDFTANVVLKEQRQAYYNNQSYGASMTLESTLAGKLNQGINDKTVMIYVDGNAETEYRGAESALTTIAGGTWVIERYDANGVRQDSNKVALAPFTAGTSSTDMTQYLDYKLELANGNDLHKNAMSTTTSGYWTYVNFEWAEQALPDPTANVPAQTLARVATSTSILPPGRYQLPWEAVTIDIYPEGVVMTSNNSGPVRLREQGDSNSRYAGGSFPNGQAVYFYFLSGNVSSSWGSTVLTAAQRIK